MFNEREMSKAIDWLFELFSPEDYEGYDEDEIGYAGGLCLPEVCTALRGAAQTVYQYSVTGGYEKCFDYRGMELFDQRACLIISDVEQAVLDEIKTTYETELWLMEDMNFAIVRCVSMMIVMLPLFFLAMYEKDGQPLEVIAGHFIQAKFIRPKVRPYQTNNYYDALVRQYQLEKEVEQIVFQEETAGKGNKNACKSESKAAERN